MTEKKPAEKTRPRFAYYNRLNAKDRAIYRASDKVSVYPGTVADVADPIAALERALTSEDGRLVARHARTITRTVVAALDVEPVRLCVRAQRPSDAYEELHGFYEDATITLFWRTAVHRRPVALRTFVRTLAHELCHHLDYALLDLEDSFHTHGFFSRETTLTRALLSSLDVRTKARQLVLFGSTQA